LFLKAVENNTETKSYQGVANCHDAPVSLIGWKQNLVCLGLPDWMEAKISA